MLSLDAERYDGPTWSIGSTSVHHFTWGQANCAHRSVTSRTITQHIETVTHHSVSARTIRSRFTAEWSVRKTSIAWSTLDAKSQTSPTPMVQSKKDVGGGME
ncbi:hypothetical protein TNCV_2935181 [Trichonephila clavipes]|nr:hypothetical protein TNCV_2935181 [Trichonephila clavipes]